VRGRSRYRPNRYRAEKMRTLERRVEFLEAEQRRSLALLGLALKAATADKPCGPFDLLDVLAADVLGTNLGRSARLEERWQARREHGKQLLEAAA
jgi:hypothetical protein